MFNVVLLQPGLQWTADSCLYDSSSLQRLCIFGLQGAIQITLLLLVLYGLRRCC